MNSINNLYVNIICQPVIFLNVVLIVGFVNVARNRNHKVCLFDPELEERIYKQELTPRIKTGAVLCLTNVKILTT